MIYYGNPSTGKINDAMSALLLGCITTPKQGNVVFPEEWDVMADNGCFSKNWQHDHWYRWIQNLPRTTRFVVAPDEYDPEGGECHKATLKRYRRYGPLIALHGFTPAFVLQVGSTPWNIPPPNEAPVLFIGGTTEWKLGSVAKEITRRAVKEGRWVHMGRVNSFKRYEIARSWGCHSVDGTFLTYGPDINLPKVLGWLEYGATHPHKTSSNMFPGFPFEMPEISFPRNQEKKQMASTSMADLLKQAEEAGISSYSPPDGPGTFRVAGANGSKTQKGDPKFGIQWEVLDGPDQGKKFWTNINLVAVKNDGQPNTMGLAMSFRELATLGADADVVAQWDTDSPTISEDVQDAVVGTIVSAEVKSRESGGYTNIDMKKLKRLESAPAPAAPAQTAPPAAGGTPPPF